MRQLCDQPAGRRHEDLPVQPAVHRRRLPHRSVPVHLALAAV